MRQFTKDWKDDFEGVTDPDGQFRLKRKGEIAAPGEYVRVDWRMMDAAPTSQVFSDDLAPCDQPFAVKPNSEQGKAWSENAQRQREAWRNPDQHRAFTYGLPSAESTAPRMPSPGLQGGAGAAFAPGRHSDAGNPSLPSYAKPAPFSSAPASPAAAQAARDAAWEERRQRDLNAWRNA